MFQARKPVLPPSHTSVLQVNEHSQADSEGQRMFESKTREQASRFAQLCSETQPNVIRGKVGHVVVPSSHRECSQ